MIIDRINIAIALLKEGQRASVDGIGLNVIAPNIIEITGYTKYFFFENLRQNNILEDLNNLKLQFQEMIEASTTLRDFSVDKKFHYFIDFDDSGKCGINVCQEIDGLLMSSNNIPK